jgi:hypothetical protein
MLVVATVIFMGTAIPIAATDTVAATTAGDMAATDKEAAVTTGNP